MLYNYGRIFLYYNFLLVISYLSVELGFELLERGEDVTITDVIIKPPDRKWFW